MKEFKIILLVLTAISATAQSPWTFVEDESTVAKHIGERVVIPEVYDTYSLDLQTLKNTLAKAPMAEEVGAQRVRLSLPVGDGQVETFEFVESPAMSPVLAAKFPMIKSYKGVSLDDPFNKAWVDFGPSEFRGILNKQNKMVFIDPYYTDSEGHYIVYKASDFHLSEEHYEKTCGVKSCEENQIDNPKPEGVYLPKFEDRPVTKSVGIPVTKVTYRFAVTSTGLWTAQQGGTVELVMQKINTAANRLNSLFETELAMKFELVDNNDELIFFTDQEPMTDFTNERRGRQCLQENSEIINGAIGSDAYDIGHCFTVSCIDSIGGVANLGSVCNDRKGNGVSCVGNANIGTFMMNTTAHEIGHQFTSGHTWGNCPSVPDQFSAAQNCEPGSGSTIMSYFNACGTENLGSPESHVFHTCSHAAFNSFLAIGDASTCGSREEPGNTHPEVWVIDEPNTIPISTPFELTGDASDMENDPLTYVWEQIDGASIAYPMGSPVGSAPAFRTFPPSTNKTRIFPRLANVLSASDSRAERLPTYSRDLNFAFTVRDNNPTAGGLNWATIKLEATEAAGPFVVTSPNSLTTAGVNEDVLVQWDVANTDGPEVDCQLVDIYFSADGGQTFPHKLITATPNDGEETVKMPNALTDNGKIKVKGLDNVFFNINQNSIRVVDPTVPSFYVDAEQSDYDLCVPLNLDVNLKGSAFAGYANDVQLEVVAGLPPLATYTFSQNPMPANGTSTLSLDMSQVLYSEEFVVVVQAVGADSDTIFQNIHIDAVGSFLGDVALQNPPDDARGIATIPEFNWSGSQNVTGYTLEISTSPSFDDNSVIFKKDMGLDLSEPEAVFNLENSTLYYWRVIMENECTGSVSTPINIFSSQALSCRLYPADDLPLNIPSAGVNTVFSEIDLAEAGTVSDVNVNIVKGFHNNLSDVRASIVSPQGTKVVLWQGCTAFNQIDAGYDDAAATTSTCPDKDGLRIVPKDPLAAFNGQELQGKWSLQIEDVVSGNGGEINEFELELCSSSSLFSPFLVFNEVLDVGPGKGAIIENSFLFTDDDNNTSDELVYTLTAIPTKGNLVRNGTILTLGDQFTQLNIDNGLMVYKHLGTVEETDKFTFVVEDGEGGWINQTDYLVNVIEGGAATAVKDVEEADKYFDIFPNPATENLTIETLGSDVSEWKVSLLQNGQSLKTRKFSTSLVMDVTGLPAGLYILKVENEGRILTKKVAIVKQ